MKKKLVSIKRKSRKKYWSSLYTGSSFTLKLKNRLNKMSESYYYFDLRRILRTVPFVPGKKILEIGCAPGGFLIFFHQQYKLAVSGMDYAKAGCQKTRESFSQVHIQGKVMHADFFDPEFRKQHRNEYDYAFSAGFIEHFDRVQAVVDAHFDLTKRGGYVIAIIPNLHHVNAALMPKKLLAIHNRTIMNIASMKNMYSKKGAVVYCGYMGGLFNIGAFQYTNPLIEKTRFLCYLIQRALFDNLAKVLHLAGIRLSSRYTSPSIIIIAKKR